MGNVYIHESSYADDNVLIGSNVRIWHFCHIQSVAMIREENVIGQNVNILNNVRIGKRVEISNVERKRAHICYLHMTDILI